MQLSFPPHRSQSQDAPRTKLWAEKSDIFRGKPQKGSSLVRQVSATRPAAQKYCLQGRRGGAGGERRACRAAPRRLLPLTLHCWPSGPLPEGWNAKLGEAGEFPGAAQGSAVVATLGQGGGVKSRLALWAGVHLTRQLFLFSKASGTWQHIESFPRLSSLVSWSPEVDGPTHLASVLAQLGSGLSPWGSSRERGQDHSLLAQSKALGRLPGLTVILPPLLEGLR